jgi:hypothetical protein
MGRVKEGSPLSVARYEDNTNTLLNLWGTLRLMKHESPCQLDDLKDALHGAARQTKKIGEVIELYFTVDAANNNGTEQ